MLVRLLDAVQTWSEPWASLMAAIVAQSVALSLGDPHRAALEKFVPRRAVLALASRGDQNDLDAFMDDPDRLAAIDLFGGETPCRGRGKDARRAVKTFVPVQPSNDAPTDPGTGSR